MLSQFNILPFSDYFIWISANDIDGNGVYTNVDGSQLRYDNLNPTSTFVSGDCVTLLGYTKELYWLPTTCRNLRTMLCSFKL